MWNPISIDQFVKIHLKNNPNDNEKVLKVRIESAGIIGMMMYYVI